MHPHICMCDEHNTLWRTPHAQLYNNISPACNISPQSNTGPRAYHTLPGPIDLLHLHLPCSTTVHTVNLFN